MSRETDDIVWRRNEIDSPCIRVCVLHPTERLCMGCFRSGEEIGRWSAMTDAERAAIRAQLPDRADLLASAKPSRRGGRRGRVKGADE